MRCTAQRFFRRKKEATYSNDNFCAVVDYEWSARFLPLCLRIKKRGFDANEAIQAFDVNT